MSDLKLEKYRRAIGQNFPQLTIEKIEYLSEGWDSLACRVNDRLIFRFPKRAEVEASLRREIKLLPELGPTLPLAIPQFKYVAETGNAGFPYPFVGYEALPGGMQGDWPEEVQAAEWWRPGFGDFLTALHAFPVARARTLGVQDYAPVGVEDASGEWRDRLEAFYGLVREAVYPLLPVERQDLLADYFENFLDDERFFQWEPVLVHGDLWDDHVLLDPATSQLGVIDFGDVAIGDPALDVSELMLPYYNGRVDESFRARRQFYGGLPPLISIIFGLRHESPLLVEFGLNSLGQPLKGFP